MNLNQHIHTNSSSWSCDARVEPLATRDHTRSIVGSFEASIKATVTLPVQPGRPSTGLGAAKVDAGITDIKRNPNSVLRGLTIGFTFFNIGCIF
jgi:hypothetical protein